MQRIDRKTEKILSYMSDPNRFLLLSVLDKANRPLAFDEISKATKELSPSLLTYYVREGQKLGLLERVSVKGDSESGLRCRLSEYGKKVFKKYEETVASLAHL